MSTQAVTGRERGAPKKVAKVVAALAAYHAAARGDSTLSLNRTAIARRCGCSDDTLRNYLKAGEQGVEEWMGKLEALRVARGNEEAARRALGDAPDAPRPSEAGRPRPAAGLRDDAMRRAKLAEVPDAALERRVSQAVEMAKSAMLRFVGQCRRDRVVVDVERVSYDLGECLAQLSGISAEMAALASEMKDRRRRTPKQGDDAQG